MGFFRGLLCGFFSQTSRLIDNPDANYLVAMCACEANQKKITYREIRTVSEYIHERIIKDHDYLKCPDYDNDKDDDEYSILHDNYSSSNITDYDIDCAVSNANNYLNRNLFESFNDDGQKYFLFKGNEKDKSLIRDLIKSNYSDKISGIVLNYYLKEAAFDYFFK